MITASSTIKGYDDKSKKKDIDVIGLGEIVVDLLLKVPHLPCTDDKVYVENREKQAGGVTANFCVGVARQGLKTSFVGAVGDDLEGTFLREVLNRERVVDKYLFSLKDKKTPVNIVMVSKEGEKAILQSEHMRLTLPPGELITKEMFDNARHLHLTAINFETALKAPRIFLFYCSVCFINILFCFTCSVHY